MYLICYYRFYKFDFQKTKNKKKLFEKEHVAKHHRVYKLLIQNIKGDNTFFQKKLKFRWGLKPLGFRSNPFIDYNTHALFL